MPRGNKALRYAPSSVPNGIGGIVAEWLRREFWAIRDALEIIATNYVASMYASMSNQASDPFPDLGSAWQNIDNYSNQLSSPSDVVVDPALGTFNFAFESTVLISFNGTFVHNELNAGRTTGIRMYNLTKSIVYEHSIVPTGIDSGATSISRQFMVKIPQSILGDRIVIQLGGGDAYIACSWVSKNMTMTNAGF